VKFFEVKPDLLRIFEMGNILHDFVVGVLKSEKTPEVGVLEWEIVLVLVNLLNLRM